MSSSRWLWNAIIATAMMAVCGLFSVAEAHPAYLTAAQLTVDADGQFRVHLRFDTLAYTLNDTSARIGNEPMEELLAGPREDLEAQLAEAKDRFVHGFRVVTDAGNAVFDTVVFPDADKVLAWRDTVQTVLPVVVPVEVTGRLPEGSKTVAARFPPVLEQVILSVERPGEEPIAEAVDRGAVSTALPVRLEAPARVESPPRVAAAVRTDEHKPLFQTNGQTIALCVVIVLLLGAVGYKLGRK